MMSKREKSVRYYVEHWKDHLLIITNKDGAKTNKLCSVPIDGKLTWAKECWKDVKPYNKAVQVDGVLPFENYVAIFGREGGIMQMWVSNLTAAKGGINNLAHGTKCNFQKKYTACTPSKTVFSILKRYVYIHL